MLSATRFPKVPLSASHTKEANWSACSKSSSAQPRRSRISRSPWSSASSAKMPRSFCCSEAFRYIAVLLVLAGA
jgi:hypothetical protein